MISPPIDARDREGHLPRRDFLRIGSLGALGLGLPTRARPEVPGHPRPQDISCILLWLQGGLSHLDSFDPKPDAPAEIRGEFDTIATRVAGIRLAAPLPSLALQQDQFSIVRSIVPGNGMHGLADLLMLTGALPSSEAIYPCLGSVVGHVRGPRGDQPPFVQLGRAIDARVGGGLLGPAFDPIVLDGARSEYQNIGLPGCSGRSEHYGPTPLGRNCFLARRLVEAGTRFVLVTSEGWDTHDDGFSTLQSGLLPALDLALSALLRDLADCGRLETTLVLCLSDFGRGPKVNRFAGRDHCPLAGVALVAGAGIRSGVVVGSTGPLGDEVVDAPYEPRDLVATISDRLGIGPESAYLGPGGRVIRELL